MTRLNHYTNALKLCFVLAVSSISAVQGGNNSSVWLERSDHLRMAMRHILTIPENPGPLKPTTRTAVRTDDYSIEAVTYESEPGSRVTASLYLPSIAETPIPRF